MSSAVKELLVPGLGESVTEARIANWVKTDGDAVTADDVVAELETDKATVELPAGSAGVLRIVKDRGQTVNVGDLIAHIEAGGAPGRPPAAASPVPAASKAAESRPPAPSVQRMIAEHNVDPAQIRATGPGNRITKADVVAHLESATPAPAVKSEPPRASAAKTVESPKPAAATVVAAEGLDETRVEMSKLRETVARRIVEAQHTAAILTTFNEVDMSAVMGLREKYKERFEKMHSVGLGFLSFFARAACAAAKAVPVVNAQIQQRTIVYKKHMHLGIAVATEKGLVVPVVRNADKLSMAQIEAEIKRLAVRAREGKISLEELGGGTFTITNGGVFGSLLSTPILNPPQSAILGLHKIEKRAVVVDDQIVIRPMMYLALSYDHRLIDGQQAVTFLVHMKESLEDPARLLLEV